MAFVQQMFEMMMNAQQQQQQHLAQLLQQQAQFQQFMMNAQVAGQRMQKKKGNPPAFNGQAGEDLELWIFSTEQFYAEFQAEMASPTSEFVDLIFGNLGVTAQTWFRDFKISLGDQPATWPLFKQRIRERFRESDFQFKTLSKLYDLKWMGSQASYTTQFQHLLSQLEMDLPESVKRWFYQQNLRAETNAFVCQNVPTTLQETIELAQRFEDSNKSATQSAKKLLMSKPKTPSPKTGQASKSGEEPRFDGAGTGRADARPTCSYCKKFGHTEAVCRKKVADEKRSSAKND